MPEEGISLHYQRGWPIPTEFLDLELYRLLCVFAASRTIAERSESDKDFYAWLKQHFERAEASRLFISIAATLRNALESAAYPEEIKKDLPQHVGTLKRDVEDDQPVKPLSFREACNKILHADLVHYDFTEGKHWHKQALNPILHLYGVHRGSEWKASVDVFKFIECGYCFT